MQTLDIYSVRDLRIHRNRLAALKTKREGDAISYECIDFNPNAQQWASDAFGDAAALGVALRMLNEMLGEDDEPELSVAAE